MPDVSYSALANWDGRLSAPGSVNGDEIPSGSRPSPRPPSASPRIDPTPNGFSHVLGSSAMLAERGRVVDSPNLLAERTERGAGSTSEKDAMRRRPSLEHLDPQPASSSVESGPVSAIDSAEQQVSRRPQISPARLASSQKPTSRSSRPGLRSPTLGKRQRSRSRPPAQDDDADSLMDADGETDHESVASVYPIQSNAESSASTPNTTTRGSTETTVVTQTLPVHRSQKLLSEGGHTNEVRDGVEKDHVSRSPSIAPRHRPPENRSPSGATSPAVLLPSAPPPTSPKAMSVNDRMSPIRQDPSDSPPSSSPLTSPDIPLRDLPPVSSPEVVVLDNPRPTKKRRLNRAYVEVPPLPPWRRRASYVPAPKLFEQVFEKDGDVDMGVDYAADLGAALNSVAALNEQELSSSPGRAYSSGRPMRATRARARESSARDTMSTRGASVSTSVSKRGGRQAASKNSVRRPRSVVPAEEPAPEIKSEPKVKAQGKGTRKGKGKGKERAQDLDPDPEADEIEGDMQGERQLIEPKEEEEEPRYSDDDLEEEEDGYLPADNLEPIVPSVRIHIGTYPQSVDGVLYVAFQRLLIASKNSVWPPRSEQSVTSSPSQAAPVVNPATSPPPPHSSQPATPPTAPRSPGPPASVPRPSPPSVPATINKHSKPVKPLPRLSHLKSIARRPSNDISAFPAPSRPATDQSARPSKASSTRAPRRPSHVSFASSEVIPAANVIPTQTNLSPPAPPLPQTPQRSLPSPHRTEPSQTLPPSPHPPPSHARTDSQQSFDFTALLTDFDAHPAPSSASTSPAQSQPSFPTLEAMRPSPPPGGFKTLQHILTHFGPGHTPASPAGDPHRDDDDDVRQNAPTVVAPHATPPTPGDRFLRSIGYEGTEAQCGSFFPWMREHSRDPDGPGGTIDPSLLGGPQPEAHPPPMSPQDSSSHSHSRSHSHWQAGPVAGPSRAAAAAAAAAADDDDAELSLEASSQSSAQSHSPQTPPDSDSGSDPGPGGDVPLSVRLQRQFPALSKDLPAVEVEGRRRRRRRRLTERALAMRHTLEIGVEDEDEDEDAEGCSRSSVSLAKGKKGAGKGKGKAKDAGKAHQTNGVGKGKGKGKGKEKAGEVEVEDQGAVSIRELAAQPTFCHQCRRTSLREKMRCSTIRPSGDTCGLRYCDRCIENRYPGMAFDAFARHFVCPRCEDTCNCTQCCARRGETYISARVGKLPPANSAEALALIKAAEIQKTQSNERSREKPKEKSGAPGRIGVVPRRMVTPPAPKFDLVPGQFFGVVYGLEGERMGQGFMGEDSQRVMMNSNSQEDREKTKGAVRGPARRKRRPRYGKAVAYIGERRVPSLSLVTSASPSLPPPTSSSTSQDSQAAPATAQAGTDQPALPPPAAALERARSIVPPPPPPPRGRMYIGDRAVLDKRTYVSMDELMARAIREEEEDAAWGGPLSDPPSMDDDDQGEAARQGAAHSTLDVQYAIAFALHTLQGSPRDQQAKVAAAAADAVRS